MVPRRHVVEVEPAAFLRQPCMEDHLEQQVAQLVTNRIGCAGDDRLGQLVGFLEGMRCDGLERLLEVPGTAVERVAQAPHDLEQPPQTVVWCTVPGVASHAPSPSRTR